ncbi:MAG: type IV toxin-antitoxin system AbiEi family antitoxin domain-containing protein [Myxococcota bacterium]
MSQGPPKVGLMRVQELERAGTSRRQAHRLVERGELLRLDRGVFAHPGFEPTQHHHLALVALRCPQAVVALSSAAAFHQLGTHLPLGVCVALPPRTWAPRLESVRVEVARFSGTRLSSDVERHPIEGVALRVYSLAKTVVDLFRYRNKLGLDVALEAMREALAHRATTTAELARIARRDGALGPMRPYLESLQ